MNCHFLNLALVGLEWRPLCLFINGDKSFNPPVLILAIIMHAISAPDLLDVVKTNLVKAVVPMWSRRASTKSVLQIYEELYVQVEACGTYYSSRVPFPYACKSLEFRKKSVR